MIIAKDGRWCICTPKKTGTHSLNSALTQRTNYGVLVSPWHGREWDGDGLRIIVAREPLERFVSMYYFVKRVQSAWLKAYDHSFETWASEFFRRPVEENPDWRLNLCGYLNEFRVDDRFTIWKTETLGDDLNALCDRFVMNVPSVSDLNSTKNRPPVAEALDQLSPKTLDSLYEWARPDAKSFGYYGSECLK